MKILEENFKLKFLNNEFLFYNAASGIQPFIIENLHLLFSNKKILIILDNNEEITKYLPTIKRIIKNETLLEFPSWDCSPYDDMSPTKTVINKRFKTLKYESGKISNSYIILTTVDALLQKVPLTKDIEKLILRLQVSELYDLSKIRKDLQNIGYKNVNLVLEPNEYALRGGIIDLWPLGEENPYRLDFFGNKLETIKSFNPISQIADNKFQTVNIEGPIEVPLNERSIEKFITNYRKTFGPVVNKELYVHTIKDKYNLEGIEHWLPLFYDFKLENIINFFSPYCIISKTGLFSKIEAKLADLKKSYYQKLNVFEENRDNYNGPVLPEKLYTNLTCMMKILKKNKLVFFNEFDDREQENTFNVKSIDNIDFSGHIYSTEQASVKINKIIQTNLGYKKIIICFNDEESKRYIEKITASMSKDLFRFKNENIEDCLDDLSVVDIISFPIEKGFETDLIKLISVNDITPHKKTKKERKFKNNITDLSQLNISDYVVHRDHGIGQYSGLKTISILEKPHDCLVIEYLNKSKLYVPVENINLISKYGSSLSNVELDKLGSSSWSRRKSNVKKKIRDLASALITTAAKRNLHKTKRLNINKIKLEVFAREFGYIETDDQNATLEEVFRDLSSEKLMDRLVCGDVGFGKTEVALRASFIISDNDLLSLVVVPSTLLAKQHFETFRKRFQNFANVGLITRFTDTKTKKKILEDFQNSSIKILITTHAIFSCDLSKAKLGLIIIDEEQHFGVAQKEKIKKFKEHVNILTLSATPIPRTLYMSLLGIRELSLIKTPPVDRKSVQTYICKFEKAIIYRAINHELKRNGQVFLVVPKISDTVKVLQKVKTILPDVKLGIAHGKLKTKEIEIVMEEFYDHKIDLLISTSIIEAGLDIPNANTLIVYKSDYFGLAQLHQLRGRIGRSKIKGYAYFSVEKNKITDNATRRLKALKAMDKLGAGINLASYDLDIRGAGNLLGEEQSGQIIQVGIELYQKLLQECLDDLKGEKKISNSSSVEINIKLPILIPENYIPDLSLRLSLYRKLGEINDYQGIDIFKDEMINRFGEIPPEFLNLLDIMYLKILCIKAKIIKLNITSNKFFIFFNKNFDSYSENFVKWITSNKSNIILNNTHNIEFLHNIETPEKQLLNVIELTNKIIRLLNYQITTNRE